MKEDGRTTVAGSSPSLCVIWDRTRSIDLIGMGCLTAVPPSERKKRSGDKTLIREAESMYVAINGMYDLPRMQGFGTSESETRQRYVSS